MLKKYRTIRAAKRAFGLSLAGLKKCETYDVKTLKPEPITEMAMDKIPTSKQSVVIAEPNDCKTDGSRSRA